MQSWSLDHGWTEGCMLPRRHTRPKFAHTFHVVRHAQQPLQRCSLADTSVTRSLVSSCFAARPVCQRSGDYSLHLPLSRSRRSACMILTSGELGMIGVGVHGWAGVHTSCMPSYPGLIFSVRRRGIFIQVSHIISMICSQTLLGGSPQGSVSNMLDVAPVLV